MKKTVSAFISILFVLTALFPAGALVCACFGYTFELISIFAFSVIIAVISVFTVIFSIISKEKINNKGIMILSYILLPLSFINAVFYIFESGQISVAICVFISFICCFILTLKNTMSKVRKVVISVLFALMTAFVLFFAFIMLMFGNIGHNTVVKTVESPDLRHYAEVVDVDQGALGGNTIVNVCEKREINAVVFKIKKKPQTVYIGDWGDSDNMEIHWKNDWCVVINSKEYEIE